MHLPRIARPSYGLFLLLASVTLAAGSSSCAGRAQIAAPNLARPASPAPPSITAPHAPPPVVVRGAGARQGSGVVLASVDGRRLAYVADEDDRLVRVVDLEDERELSTFAPGGAPARMVMLADGRLVVSLRDANTVVVLRGAGTATSPLATDVRMDLAAEPIGLALTPDDATLVATSGWGRKVTTFDAYTFVRKAEHSVAREPRDVVIAEDGSRAFVAHAVGPALDVVPLDLRASPPPKPIELGGLEEVAAHPEFLFTQKRAACQGFALARSADGRVFAPHVLVFPGEAEASPGYGGSLGRVAEVFHVPVIDEGNSALVPESRILRSGLGGPGSACTLPRAATVGKAGLYVTCLGEDTVELFDADALHPHDVKLATWHVPAGPTAIALDEERHRAIVWSQFAHALTTIAIGDDGLSISAPLALSSLSLPRANVDDQLERGRAIFHATRDTRISKDGRACASCHPDGRDDALVWSSPKGPRQTPMLAGRLEGAAPFGWNGDAPDVSKHLVQTVKRLGGTGLDGEDERALVAYIRTMRPPPAASPRTPPDSIARGEAIFRSERAGCAGCHGASGDLPDGAQHDVKSRAAADVVAKFDTPSLRFVAGTAPYFHDGRYPDLRTLLVKSDGKMGHTKHLLPEELADLEAYLETL